MGFLNDGHIRQLRYRHILMFRRGGEAADVELALNGVLRQSAQFDMPDQFRRTHFVEMYTERALTAEEKGVVISITKPRRALFNGELYCFYPEEV